MQRKTAKEEAWRPRCAAPRLVYYSALFLETILHARPNIFREKRGNPLEVRSRDGHVEHMRAKYQDLSLKNGVDIWTLVRKACVFYAVACNYLVLV